MSVLSRAGPRRGPAVRQAGRSDVETDADGAAVTLQGEPVHEVAGGLPCLRARSPGWRAGCGTTGDWDGARGRRSRQPLLFVGEVVDVGRGLRPEPERRPTGRPAHGGHPDELRRLRSGPGLARPVGVSGRRSIRRVSTPSSMAATASPSMAKSMKSAWACSLNRSRSGPSIGGRPRDRTASARARNRSTMAWGSNSSGMARWYRSRRCATTGEPPALHWTALVIRWSPRVRRCRGHATAGGARSCFREEGTPSPLRRSAQPEAVGRHRQPAVPRVRRRARRQARLVVPGHRGRLRRDPRHRPEGPVASPRTTRWPSRHPDAERSAMGRSATHRRVGQQRHPGSGCAPLVEVGGQPPVDLLAGHRLELGRAC